MEILFVADGNEKAYAKYIPEIQKTIRFKNSGEKQDIPDAIAEQLLKDFPRMFGRTMDDVKKARGMPIEKPLKEEVAKEMGKESEKSKHPFVAATKKVEKLVNKNEGKLDKVDRKPVRKLVKRKGTK